MEHTGDGCLFCALDAGTMEISLVWRDADLTVVMDAHPVNPGHTLVVVRRHGSSLEDLDDQLGAHLWSTARRVARGLRRCGLRCEAVNILVEDIEGSHLHMHVFPRFAEDDFVIDADCEPRDRRLLNREASLLRAAMATLIPRAVVRR